MPFVFIACLASCDNEASVKKEADTLKNTIDTLLNKVKNSEAADSLRAKGGRIKDSFESKGGKLLEKAKEKFNDLKKKD